ncbi:cytoplasmic protein [Salmonella enterica subsp. enterica serovar Litchfield]|nr:cytoplasmic protein [Salmonella enterica subsp. enterica serovar Litchfield]
MREAGAEYSPTDDDVSYVLRVIGKAGSAGVWRYGLGLEFVADELSKIAAARTSRQIAVPEDALRVLLPLMEAGMNIPRYQTPDTVAGELAALDTLKTLLAVPFTQRPAE